MDLKWGKTLKIGKIGKQNHYRKTCVNKEKIEKNIKEMRCSKNIKNRIK